MTPLYPKHLRKAPFDPNVSSGKKIPNTSIKTRQRWTTLLSFPSAYPNDFDTRINRVHNLQPSWLNEKLPLGSNQLVSRHQLQIMKSGNFACIHAIQQTQASMPFSIYSNCDVRWWCIDATKKIENILNNDCRSVRKRKRNFFYYSRVTNFPGFDG